jgi:HSP20 family protein
MAISRWEPVSSPLSVRDAANHLFDHGVWWPMRHEHAVVFTPMDVYANGDGYLVELALPGVMPDDLEMQVTGTQLTVSGEFKPAAPEGYRCLVSQRQTGPFRVALTLPDAADSAQVTATFEQGVLRLAVPKSEASKPKRIELKSAG